MRRDGTPVTQGQKRENLWQVMRILRRFTPRELAVSARTPECMVGVAEAAEYCRYLHLAGYLTRRGGLYQMHATSFTGPRAPMIQRTRRVWDPNRNEVRWQGGEVRDDE